MKAITLTKRQEERLLKMCRKLFPEYKNISFNTDPQYDGTEDFVFLDQECIHWFEFCMTHLVERVLNPEPKKPNRDLQANLKNFFWEMSMYSYSVSSDGKTYGWEHPVDYLYNEFKKLKQ